MAPTEGYELVKLRNGAYSIRSCLHGETMHPGLGPEREAETLYVHQVRLIERLRSHDGEFVIWDVGLGAAANALTVLRASRNVSSSLRIISFDNTLEPLRFASNHHSDLGFFRGYEPVIEKLLAEQGAEFENGQLQVRWDCCIADFPALLRQPLAQTLSKPHLVIFDPWSPSKNPLMWTVPIFTDLFGLLDPSRPCALPTYSRSTMTRAALLLAGFWVGAGSAAGRKEQTTIASNVLGLLTGPLDHRWLERARRSLSAEPLWEPYYRQAPLTPTSWERLRQHPQFR